MAEPRPQPASHFPALYLIPRHTNHQPSSAGSPELSRPETQSEAVYLVYLGSWASALGYGSICRRSTVAPGPTVCKLFLRGVSCPWRRSQ